MEGLDAPFEDERRVPFEGPHGGLVLVFDPASLPGGAAFDGFPRATVAFRTAGVRVTMRATFFDWALPPFVQALATAHAALRGGAVVKSEDGDFSLKVAYGDRGDVTVTGHLQPDLYDQTVLTYEIATDQSYLSATLIAVRNVLAR